MQKKYEICLRLSQEEKTLLENSARCCGLSKTAYLRRLILGAEVRALPSQEIKALRTEIHHIGNNINQIARSVNAGIAKPDDAKHGLYMLDRVYELMYQVAKSKWLLQKFLPGKVVWMSASTMCSMAIRLTNRFLQPI